jgi:transmembrane protein EpsG
MFFLAVCQTFSRSKKQGKKVYIFMCVLLVLLAILKRDDVGVDSGWYTTWFYYCRSAKWSSLLTWNGIEPGYNLLNKVIGLFTSDIQVFYAVHSLLVYPPIFVFLYNYSRYPGLSLMTFITMGGFEFNYGILRQACAGAVVILAYRYVKERNFKKYLLGVLLATTFHWTALITLPLYFLYGIKINRKTILALFILSGVLFLLGKQILNIAMTLFPKYQSYDLDYSAGRNKFIFLWIMIFLIYEIFMRKHIKDGWYHFLFSALLIAAVFQSLAMIMEIFERATSYFKVGMYILYPELVRHIFTSKKIGTLFFWGVMAMGAVFFVYYRYVIMGEYYFMWEI